MASVHGELIEEVAGEVDGEIALRARVPAPGEPARIEAVAADLRKLAFDEAAQAERDQRRERVLGRIAQVTDYLFFVVYGLLGLRFVLALVGARRGADFTQFVESVTDPFFAPFRGIVASANLGDGHVVALPIVVAFFAYVLLHLSLAGLFRLLARRRTTV